MHLLLVRHGQSANNILEAAHGCGEAFNKRRVVDPPLSALGFRQAQLLGRHLGAQLRRAKPRIRLVCSSMTRACQTIEPLASSLALSPVVHPDVHEVKGFYATSGPGNQRGPTRAALQQLFPGYDASLIPEEGQGSELCRDAFSRARRVISMLNTWASEDPSGEEIVVLVSHNDFIGLLARQLLVPSGQNEALGDEPELLFTESYWPMNNTGVSHFVLGARPPRSAYKVPTYLIYWNRSDHLTEEVRSGVQFINIGLAGAGEWARVGEGGSGVLPLFKEHETISFPHRSRPWTHVMAIAAGAAALATAAALLRSRPR